MTHKKPKKSPRLNQPLDLGTRVAIEIFARQLAAERPQPPYPDRTRFLAEHAVEAGKIFAGVRKRKTNTGK